MKKKSVSVMVGDMPIGGGAPVSIQSMTNTDTSDVQATIGQIDRLVEAGCELVRVAVPNEVAAKVLGIIKSNISVPLIADIHFSAKLAVMAIEQGVDKVRINPGTLGGLKDFERIISAAKERGVSLRIGVNSGSVEKEMMDRYEGRLTEALIESTLRAIDYLEKQAFYDIVLSLKTTSVSTTVEAYERIAEKVSYPLHVGVTEAGRGLGAVVKSSIGIGSLLLKGIGDTIRVSLTGDPVREVEAAKKILQAVGLRAFGPEIISCPTCARCKIDLDDLVMKIESLTKNVTVPLKIAVMGCPVNGPGEAREADLGVSGAGRDAILFRKGELLKKVPVEKLEEEFLIEFKKLASSKSNQG
ncbi:MAG TPA: flavodoxin-dependent (E)-4-hydroxy-3-methylbut-2-enyl-diphosphate synthase [Firmicutes bacterium]|nr:flavodoxin-dependent (E)-4-hydroxy-3-methylbut-2-enyl-diphosphate synthase [Bacillota bacterium]